MADPWLMPITFWMTIWHDPLETVRLTADPGLTCWPPDGLEPVTMPLAEVLEQAVEVDPTLRPCWPINPLASLTEIPATDGTATVLGWATIVSVTVVPFDTEVPASGSWETTVLGGRFCGFDDAVVTLKVKPSACSLVSASARAKLWILGTLTFWAPEPLDTFMSIRVPRATGTPERGLVDRTVLAGLAESRRVIVPTSSPTDFN